MIDDIASLHFIVYVIGHARFQAIRVEHRKACIPISMYSCRSDQGRA